MRRNKTSVNSVNSVGEQTQPSHLCKSVKSVGGLTQPNSHETYGKMATLSRLVQRRPLHPFRMFRGRSGYGKMPYPPKEYNNKNKCE